MRILLGILASTLVAVVGCGSGGGSEDDRPVIEPTAGITASPLPAPTTTASPTVTPSPFPEIVLAVGRSFVPTKERTIVLRNDGGGWEEIVLGVPALTGLEGIVFSTPETAWAFGQLGDLDRGVLLRSDDAGLSWRDMSANLAPQTPGILDLAFADPSNGAFVGRRTFGGPIAVATHDGGGTWPDGVPVPSFPMGGSYAIATRAAATEVLVRDANGLSVFRVDEPDAAAVVLTPESLPYIPEFNALATLGPRAWVATTVIVSPFEPPVAGIFTSAEPGAAWVLQPVADHPFAQVDAIDVRDPSNGIVGGRGNTTPTSRVAPFFLVMAADGASWDLAAPTAIPPGLTTAARVVDVARLRGDGAWAIVTDFVNDESESRFLRSDDGGKTWTYALTPFEHRVRLVDLARNTTTTH